MSAKPRKGKSYSQTGSLFKYGQTDFQENICLTSHEPAPYFKLDVNFILFFYRWKQSIFKVHFTFCICYFNTSFWGSVNLKNKTLSYVTCKNGLIWEQRIVILDKKVWQNPWQVQHRKERNVVILWRRRVKLRGVCFEGKSIGEKEAFRVMMEGCRVQ